MSEEGAKISQFESVDVSGLPADAVLPVASAEQQKNFKILLSLILSAYEKYGSSGLVASEIGQLSAKSTPNGLTQISIGAQSIGYIIDNLGSGSGSILFRGNNGFNWQTIDNFLSEGDNITIESLSGGRVRISATGGAGPSASNPGNISTGLINMANETVNLNAGSGPNYWQGYMSAMLPQFEMDIRDVVATIWVGANQGSREIAIALMEKDVDVNTVHLVARSEYKVSLGADDYGMVRIPMVAKSDKIYPNRIYYALICTQGYVNTECAGYRVGGLQNAGKFMVSCQYPNVGNWNSNDEMELQLENMEIIRNSWGYIPFAVFGLG